MKKPIILLLDAHAIIHRAYHALPDFATRSGVPTGAIYGFATMILKIIDDFKPTYVVACFDLPGKTFRHESYTEYKGTRSQTDTALKMQFEATRELCDILGIPIYDAPGFEADDMLGTICTQLKEEAVNIIIASGDMDTLQLVEKKRVQVYTLKRGLHDTIIYDEQAVFDRFGFKPVHLIDYKGLRGDTSDNIPGIKGIGEKAAAIAIQHFGTLEHLYQALATNEQLLIDAGLSKRMVQLIKDGKEDAEFSKVLATIRHDAPIDFSLPHHPWGERLDIEKASSFFERYELRALPARLKSSMGITEVAIEQEEEIIPEQDFKMTAIALWLLDSEMKEASLEDMLIFSKKKTFVEASAYIMQQLHEDEASENIFKHIEIPLMSVITHMQDRGITVDVDFFTQLSVEYHQKLDVLDKDIQRIAGVEFNIRSPKQLSEVLFEQLGLSTKGIKKSGKSGVYSTNAQMLEKLIDEHEIIQHILDYRELDKLVGTYIDVIPQMVSEDGRLHAQFIQNGTTTGRFSSKDPNMQNIPTRSDLGRKIREGFIAPQGYQLVSFDYSQIELRCLAMLSGDQKLINIFNEGKDIHTAVASLIGGVPEDMVDREMRRKAKIVNFGILYGMGVNSLRKQMNSDRSEAQKFHDGFFEQFKEATAYLEATKEHARTHGYTTTLFGRKRQFKNINSKLPFIKSMAERMALNAPIQGTSADMIKLAMVAVFEYLSKHTALDAHFVLQIHDEIIFEVKDTDIEVFTKKVNDIMVDILSSSYLSYDSPIPLVVHYSSGRHWGELK